MASAPPPAAGAPSGSGAPPPRRKSALDKIPRSRPPVPPRTVIQAVQQFQLDPMSPEYQEYKYMILRKHRTRNFAVAGTIAAFVVGTYYYTLWATKQEDFDMTADQAAKPAASSSS